MSANKNEQGLFRKTISAAFYSVAGSWTEHQARLDKLKRLKELDNAENGNVAEELSSFENQLHQSQHSQREIEQQKFIHLVALKSFDEVAISNVMLNFKHSIFLFCAFLLITSGITVYVIYNSLGLTQIVCCLMAIVLFFLKMLESWWRFTQLRERRLMSFRRWLIE